MPKRECKVWVRPFDSQLLILWLLLDHSRNTMGSYRTMLMHADKLSSTRVSIYIKMNSKLKLIDILRCTADDNSAVQYFVSLVWRQFATHANAYVKDWFREMRI